jgi:iron(III) transport system ATP-binding protein
MPSIALKGLTKSFPAAGGAVAAVDALDLDITGGQFVTLLGPSGCGKTTILRLIAGELAPDAGTIHVDGKLLSSPETVAPPEQRGMALVSGHDAIASGLTPTGDALALVELTGLAQRDPNALSGSERQRMALAHALAAQPKTLLLDEPLWNLDAKLRERIWIELKNWQRRTGATIVSITHNQAEALALSDRLTVIHAGRLQQYGTPQEIYASPANRLVADIVGVVNIIPAKVIAIEGRLCQVEAQRGLKLDIPLPPGVGLGDRLDIAVRPENIRLIGGDVGHAKIAGRTFFGHLSEYQASLDTGQMLRVQTHPGQVFAIGEIVEVAIDSMQCTVFRSNP